MGAEIMELLLNLNREGTTIVMVTHDERIAQKTHRIIRLLDGKIQA
jgi:putative ABC transport system ATP-binding protein